MGGNTLMAKRVLSIEIGQQVTKAVVIDYMKKNPHVYNAFSFPTPDDAIDDGYIKNKEGMAKLLREQMRDNGVKEKNVVFSIASSKIATREVTVPFVSESKLGDLIKATAQDYFPVNIDEYTIAYSIVDTIKENDKKSLKLQLLAAPDTLIQNYYNFARALGVDIVSLDYYGNSSMQVLKRHISSGHCICVQMGTRSTMVSVMKEGQQIMQRTIPYGTDYVVEVLMECEPDGVTSTVAAMEMLCRENVLYSSLDYEDIETIQTTKMTEEQWKRSHQNQDTRKAVTDAVGSIILNIVRVIDYFHSKYPGIELTSAYITGAGVKIRGVDTLFSNELGLTVHRLESLNNITFSRNFTSRLGDQTEYIAAIGAAMEPIGFQLKEIAEGAERRENSRIVRGIFALSVIVSVVMLLTSWMGYHSAKTENEDLQAQKDSMSYINAIFQENTKANEKYNEAKSIDAATKNRNNKLNSLLQNIEKKLPTIMKVTNLSAKDDGVTMTINTTTKISVARMLMNLEDIKELTNYQIPSVTESKKNGVETYDFTVSASYPVEADEEGAEGQAASGQTEEAK